MIRQVKRLLYLLPCLLLILGLTPFDFDVQAAQLKQPGYDALQTENQQYVYEKIQECVSGRKESIELDQSKKITTDDLSIASRMFVSDHPECFWYGNAPIGQSIYSCSVIDGSGEVVLFKPLYYLDETLVDHDSKALTDGIKAFEDAVGIIIRSIPSSAKSAYDKALYLHDVVAAMVEYKQEGDHQTAYGALVGKKAVCAGYARAYQVLLHKAGISSWVISGQGKDPKGNTVPHAWNVVWINNRCYYTDVTWDDQGERLFHAYFNRSLAQFQKDHAPDAVFEKALASCGHTDLDCFQVEAGENSGVAVLKKTTTAAQLAKYFTQMEISGETGDCFVALRTEGVSFNTWWDANDEELMDALGLSSMSLKYYSIGDEYQLKIIGELAQKNVPVTRVKLDVTALTLTAVGQKATVTATVEPANATDQNIVFSSSDPSVAKVDSKTGEITAVSAGTAKITAASVSDPAVTATCAVTVSVQTAEEYSIQIINGKASFTDGTPASKAVPGTLIIITADSAPEGMEFDYWKVAAGTAELDIAILEQTSFYMPEGFVSIEAVYSKLPVAVSGVKLDQSDMLINEIGISQTLRATVSPQDAANQKLIWSSSDTGVATVRNGVVTAVGYGTAVITVKTEDGGFTAQCQVTVQAHQHDDPLQFVAKIEPTCTQPGHMEYYACHTCGAWFADEKAQIQIADRSTLVLPAAEHTASEWKHDDHQHWRICVRNGCDYLFENTRAAHTDENRDGKCDECAAVLPETVPPTDPSDPSDPTEPSAPTDPTEPSNPVDSTDASEPTEGGGQPTDPTEDGLTPGEQDGEEDQSWIIWVIISLVVGLIAAVVYFILRRRYGV